jgi:hypothetical protein
MVKRLYAALPAARKQGLKRSTTRPFRSSILRQDRAVPTKFATSRVIFRDQRIVLRHCLSGQEGALDFHHGGKPGQAQIA